MIAAALPTWAAVVGIIAGIFGIAAGLAGFVAYFRSNMGKATIDLLEANNNALAQQNGLQQLQLDKQEATIAGLKVTVSAQQGQIAVLQELASGKKAVEELDVKLTERHLQLLAAINGRIVP